MEMELGVLFSNLADWCHVLSWLNGGSCTNKKIKPEYKRDRRLEGYIFIFEKTN